MALASYARNLYAPTKFVDVSVVTLVLVTGATPRDATRSSPDTTAVDATGGDYTCTMPSGVAQILLGAECVNSNTDRCEITALTSTAGVTTFTASKSDNVALGAGEEMHVTFLVFNQ